VRAMCPLCGNEHDFQWLTDIAQYAGYDGECPKCGKNEAPTMTLEQYRQQR
jgi:hypothetical protein